MDLTNVFRKPILDEWGLSELIVKKSAIKKINSLPTLGTRAVWNQNTIWENCVVKKIGNIQVYWDPIIGTYRQETDYRYIIS